LEKVRHGSGKSETQPGKSETQEPEKVRHESGKSETLFKLLKPLITSTEPLKPLKPPHPKNLDLTTRASAPTARTGVVVENSSWDLAALLNHNRVSQKLQKKLFLLQADAIAFVSWLLYCASRRGNAIRDPVSYTLSVLLETPHRGAGGAFENLARLSPHELSQLFAKALVPDDYVSDTDWKQAMGEVDVNRLRTVANCLFDVIPTSRSRLVEQA